MNFDKIIESACANTTTTTTATTTALPTTTTQTTTAAPTTTTASTSTTTTCGEQSLGLVSPDIFSSAITYFGSFAAGRYRIVYKYGAMRYRSSPFKINDEGFSHGFRIVHSSGLSIMPGPGDSIAYGSQSACEIGNIGALPIEFDHGGGNIGMFLEDGPYTDNGAGSTSNPTFELISLCGGTTTSTTTQSTTTLPPTTTGSTTTASTTTTTTSTTTTTATTTHPPITTSTTTTACPNGYDFSACNGVGSGWRLCCPEGYVPEHNPDYVSGRTGCFICVPTTTLPPATTSSSTTSP